MTSQLPRAEKLKLWAAMTAIVFAALAAAIGVVLLLDWLPGWVGAGLFVLGVSAGLGWMLAEAPGAPRWFRKRGGV